jgi:aminopeptidase-like protein/aminoglycoside N3'-acetyltransferase
MTSTNEWDYTPAMLQDALAQVGIQAGDVLFCHVCFENWGHPQGCATPAEAHAMLLAALRAAVGPAGTLFVPTFTFSACRREPFDVQQTPTSGGPWSTSAGFLEYVRQQPGAVRSADPIHSVVGLGPQAPPLLADLPLTCFGPASVQQRIRQAGGKICMLGIGLYEASLIHHAETLAGVPFRYKKLFPSLIADRGNLRREGWIYDVRIQVPNADLDQQRVEQQARNEGICQVAAVGREFIRCAPAQPLFDLLLEHLSCDPWYTVQGPAGDPVAIEDERVQGCQYDVHLPPNATMEQMIDALWWLPRDIVSTGYDSALHALASQVPMTIHEYPTGTECWTWIVPEKWTCYEAYLETLDGQRLFAYADHPLHVVSYSLPFEGEVSREVLFQHLHTHPALPDAIPFIFKYYERDWGLCCSKNLKDSLTDERYRVVIRATFSYSTLKVGEVVVPGHREECIVLAAHLCHPAMVNDDLSGVVVGIDVMRELLKRQDLEYTYRFLIVPETIGSIAYLSHNEHLIPHLRGGLFLEMLGIDNPHAIQLSYTGTTSMDQCVSLAARHADPYSWTAPFRQVIQNDEVQFNAPGVRVPMLSLSRVLPSSPRLPYREYHSSHDTPANASLKRMAESRDLVLTIIDTLEQNEVPVNQFVGEVFCSRYGLHIDWYTNPEGNKALFDIMHMIDGSRSLADIAEACGISFQAARQTIDELVRHGLVRYRRA